MKPAKLNSFKGQVFACEFVRRKIDNSGQMVVILIVYCCHILSESNMEDSQNSTKIEVWYESTAFITKNTW